MNWPHQPADAARPRRRLLLGSTLAAVTCGAALLATSPGLPMVWDEGNAILRARQIADWAGQWRLDEEAISQGWPYTTAVEGHPALYGIVIAAGQFVSGGWLAPLSAARFGPIVLFAAAAGAMFYRIGREYSITAALGAVAAMLLLPRLFAHAHFASFDGPLTSCWVLAWATFAPARRGWTGSILWGIVLGMTFSCKATGWLAPLPFLIWGLAVRDRACLRALAVGLPVAVLTFFALNPPLWHHPLEGAEAFFQLNLNRAANPGLNISTQFLGRMYNLDHPLPWYNTLVWTAVSVPVGILLLAGVAVVAALRRWREDKAALLLVANWLVLLVIRALPGTPPHDGVRLFLPSFAFLAALAGIGCGVVLGRQGDCPDFRKAKMGLSPWRGPPWPKWTRFADIFRPRLQRLLPLAAVVLIYAGSAGSLLWYAPQWLSYYSLSIGGLTGATAAGMEPTYYWDGLDRSVLDWLHAHTGPDEKIRFAAASPENLTLMRRWGTLRRDTGDEAPGRFRWYVIQHRPSGWQPADHRLIEQAAPAHRKTIRRGGIGPWRLDVPLVEVYEYRQYLRVRGK